MSESIRDASYWHRAWLRRTVQIEDLLDKVDDLENKLSMNHRVLEEERTRYETMIQSLQGSLNSANETIEALKSELDSENTELKNLMESAAKTAFVGKIVYASIDEYQSPEYVVMPYRIFKDHEKNFDQSLIIKIFRNKKNEK